MRQGTGLRERKRLATRRQIETSAVDLVLEHGYDAVTVEMICAASNISTRSFFNYFPSKDAAVVGEMINIPDEDSINRIIDDHPSNPLLGVVRVFESTLVGAEDEFELVLLRQKIVKSNPELMQRHFRTMLELEEAVTTVVEKRLRANPQGRHLTGRVQADEEALAIVMTAGTAMKYVFRRWQATGRTQSRAELLTPALELMAEIIRPTTS
ncbi:TetR family transcriptional regulator [Rhodococcoides trifolii]|uniref:TetR family transcriptional regulator n=1 Tax=Rhodococcoides trifolii TaxID=908250 RepID=A0A917G1N5_9NOCA|nr:TetR/AcrR family transcriptional regulator [Rhodococcus trifolii]GGG18541.1 TetR family transcriptional regulator [Rhodococcus trifolii]